MNLIVFDTTLESSCSNNCSYILKQSSKLFWFPPPAIYFFHVNFGHLLNQLNTLSSPLYKPHECSFEANRTHRLYTYTQGVSGLRTETQKWVFLFFLLQHFRESFCSHWLLCVSFLSSQLQALPGTTSLMYVCMHNSTPKQLILNKYSFEKSYKFAFLLFF